jgi:DTW domain-containing protein YfiP
LQLEICVCAVLPRVEARTKIVLIRGGEAFDAAPLNLPGTALLYCSGPPRSLAFVPTRLIVLDGSFRQARRMYKRVPELRDLPELTLPAPRVTPTRLRKPTQPDGMSTIEAIASALSLLEGAECAAPLWALHAELVRRADYMRGRKREIVSAGP